MPDLIDPYKPLDNPDHEAFAQLVASGERPAPAWKETVGTHVRGVARAKASDLLKKPGIKARVDALRNSAGDRIISVQKYREILSEAFLASAEKQDIYALTRIGQLLGKTIGAEAPAELTLRNGGVSADYNPPSRIANLSDGELKELVEEAIRGMHSEQSVDKEGNEDKEGTPEK